MIAYHNLLDQNPWWQDSNYAPMEADWPRRHIFDRIQKNLKKDLAILITGLRRTGKSSIQRQLIADLLEDGVPGEKILYFSFDKYAVDKTPEALEFIITTFVEQRLKQKIFAIADKVYLFLDEIQYVEYWQDIVKRYYDQNKNLKFILTGSQSTKLKGKSKESLAGRIIEYSLSVLEYQEYLKISGQDLPVHTIWDFGLTGYDELYDYHYMHGPALQTSLPAYLCYGQFPEIAALHNEDIKFAYDYIREAVLGKILEQDIPHHYGIEKVQAFKAMAHHLLTNSSSIFEIKNIGGDLGLAKTTAEKYLSYLREGFLVDVLYQYTRSEIKKGRLLKKAYATSVNFIAAVNNYQPDYYDKAPEIFGKLIETFVWHRLKQRFYKIFLWRKGEKEIDFLGRLTDEKQDLLPIEVKFSNRIKDKELKTILTFADKKQCATALITTRDLLDRRTTGNVNVLFVPYYLL